MPNALVEVDRDVFLHESVIRFYRVRLQTRMTVLRLSGERLLLYSPTPLDAALRAALEAAGRVAWVVSPNKIHNQTLAAYAAAYPDACMVAPPGLAERRPGLRLDAVIGGDSFPDWQGQVDCALTGGNVFFSELLLFHRASRSLIVADLVENLEPGSASALALRLAALFGVPQRPVASPEHRLYTLDADAAAASLARPRTWDFERILLCHGACVEHGAKEVFAGVCDEMLGTARRRRALARAAVRLAARIQ
ncbi:MAG: DUF4336 domain-containing protein [Deltaproteobacteria bacterium]|nr:DUF4336 domain-containing protein [Deltaproteobacteria bacterium]MBW2414945.1 DUF4336 domain-containing protein [Deltaproteobacteria bacterium]